MRSKLLKCLLLVLPAVAPEGLGRAQASFQDLSFEDGIIIPEDPTWPFSVDGLSAMPGWKDVPTQIPFDTIYLDSAGVSLHDTNSRYVRVLSGNYSVFLQPSRDGQFFPSLAQTGTVPNWARWVTFMTDRGYGSIGVRFNGQAFPFHLASGTGDPYYLWAADISAFAGQTGELMFRGSGTLDSIGFSPDPIPKSPSLAQPALRKDGAFEFKVLGQAGQPYRIQYSTNTIDWITLTNLLGTVEPITVTDPTATNSAARFYRCVSP